MVNYKQHQKLMAAGVETKIGGTIIYLTEQTAASSTADAMYHASAVYTVTTGKTFRCHLIRYLVDATGGGGITIYSADTEDATTAALKVVDLAAPGAGVWCEQYIDISVASGKFITIVPSTTQVIAVELVGYEI